MSWNGVRDTRLVSSQSLTRLRAIASKREGFSGLDAERLLDHIDALHNIMRYCHEQANEARSEEMTSGNPGWSTMAAIEVLLEEHLPQEETTTEDIINDTTISGYYVHGPVIDPPDRWCPRCHEDEHACTCNQPPHEQDYLSAWRGGAFDDDLCGCAEELAYVGFERVVTG